MQNPMVPYFQRVDVPGRAFRGNRYTDTHTQTDYCNPLVHVRRGLMTTTVMNAHMMATSS